MGVTTAPGGHQGHPGLREHIVSWAKKYTLLLGLEAWRITLRFKGVKKKTLAETSVEWPYHVAEIVFDLNRLVHKNEDEQRLTVIHELLHCITWRLMAIFQGLARDTDPQLLRDLEEEFVTQLEEMPLWKEE